MTTQKIRDIMAIALLDVGKAVAKAQDALIELYPDAGTPTTPAPNPVPPSGVKDPFNLRVYKLTLPVNSKGELKGDAHEIKQPELLSYKGTYFIQRPESLTFTCPDKGATTDTAKYPRCELRMLKEWDLDATVTNTIKFSIDSTSKLKSGDKIVVHQIHNASAPLVKMVWDTSGQYRALVKITNDSGDKVVPVLTGVKINDVVESTLAFSGKTLSIIAKNISQNGPLMRFTIDMSGRKGTSLNYFKSGNYYQNNEGKGMTAVVKHWL